MATTARIIFLLVAFTLSALLLIALYSYFSICCLISPNLRITKVQCIKNNEVKFRMTTENPTILISCEKLFIATYVTNQTGYITEEKLTYLDDYNCSQESFYEGMVYLYNKGTFKRYLSFRDQNRFNTQFL